MEQPRKVHRNHYFIINERLKLECLGFKQRFKELKQKIDEKRSNSTVPKSDQSNYLKNLYKKLEIHKKEHASLKRIHQSHIDINLEFQLEQQIKGLNNKLRLNIKENERLNRQKFFKKNKSEEIKSIFELEEELFEHKNLIQSLTEKNTQTNDLIDKTEERIKKLKEKYEELGQKIEPSRLVESEKKAKFEALENKLRVLQTNLNSKQKRLGMRIIDLEKLLKAFNMNYYTSKTKLFKRNQQTRLIEMSKSEILLGRAKTRSPKKDQLHPDVSFFYKPSISRLYY